MPHPNELTFANAIGTYNAFWDLGGKLVMDPKVGDHDNWLLTFRQALRGMHARIVTVDRSYIQLHGFQSHAPGDMNPNEWGMLCESYAAEIFFGMDSALECFVFALNVLGFVRLRGEFCDITDAKALRQVSPKNILGGDSTDKRNPKPGYQKMFPRVAALWKTNEALISTIFEYHDVSKHRSSFTVGCHIRHDPKQPDSLMSSTVHTVESIAHAFQKFMDDLLPMALQEAAAAFGYIVDTKTLAS
jgi:hypothetical protein